jgi:hypothetical protein
MALVWLGGYGATTRVLSAHVGPDKNPQQVWSSLFHYINGLDPTHACHCHPAHGAQCVGIPTTPLVGGQTRWEGHPAEASVTNATSRI